MNQNEIKICSRCKKEYPNTNEFFYKKRDKLRSICKECDNSHCDNSYRLNKVCCTVYARELTLGNSLLE